MNVAFLALVHKSAHTLARDSRMESTLLNTNENQLNLLQ